MATENLGNTSSYLLMPEWLRRKYLEAFDKFDDEWKPWLSQLCPKKIAPGRGSKRYWTRDYSADPQGMATFHNPEESIEPMNFPDVRPWSYWTRMLGNAFRRPKDLFEEDFIDNSLTREHAAMMRNLTRFINRAIEFELVQFAYGNETEINRFTDQNTDRMATVNIDGGTFNGAASDLGGIRWDDFSGDTPPIFEDLAYLKERYEYMANKMPEYFMIGRKTQLAFELNDDLLDRLIRIEDTTQGILGSNLMGLNLIRVVGQTYKDPVGEGANQLGMPGYGDYLRHTWERANKHDMMTHEVGDQEWEFGLIASGDIGEVSCGWVDQDHKDQRGSPTNIFIEQWEERNPKAIWTTAKLMICPQIYDFADVMPIRQMVHSD